MDLNKYVGIPYKINRSDFSASDCWGLVRLFYLAEFRIHLPSKNYKTRDEAELYLRSTQNDWFNVPSAEFGDVILFRILGKSQHIGVYLEQEQFLHTMEGRNSTIERIDDLSWQHRRLGYYKCIHR